MKLRKLVASLPVLVQEHQAGFFSATYLAMEVQSVGLGSTAREALENLGRDLLWNEKRFRIQTPDFFSAELLVLKVKVFAEYSMHGMVDFYPEPIVLPVLAVTGESSKGIKICVLPQFQIQFRYREPKQVKELASTFVTEALRGSTPREISRYLPPERYYLDELKILLGKFSSSPREKSLPRVLAEVSEPLASPTFRKNFSKAWGREAQVENLLDRFDSSNPNLVVLGDERSGKTTVIADAALRYERRREGGTQPEHLFWLTSGSRLVAGMKYLGMWEERVESLIAALSDLEGFLCLENLLELVTVGGTDPNASIAAFLIPYLERGQIKVLAEATQSELDSCRRLLPRFASLFEVVVLEELSRARATEALTEVTQQRARDLHLEVDPEVPDLVLSLFRRFSPYQSFPGQSTPFIDKLFQKLEKHGEKRVGAREVRSHFVQETGLPELLIRDDRSLEFDDVVKSLEQKVIGQRSACEAAAQIAIRLKACLNDPQRPVGVLFFSGPTGVGKTALAKALSHYLYGAGRETDRLIRLDMSEFSGYHAADRLLGVAGGEPSDFVKRVRAQPYCVVLFDEIEKAASDVFDLLLGLLDEGRLTDALGRTTSLRSAVVILTSNLGADQNSVYGFGSDRGDPYGVAIREFFRPEFFNRIDRIVTFNPLSEDVIHEITEKELREIAGREGFVSRGLRLVFSREVVRHLAQLGFDRQYGARPLQRVLEQQVATRVAKLVVEDPELRNQTLVLSSNQGELTVLVDG